MMDWGADEDRVTEIGLHKGGMAASDIFKTLKNLKITQKFVYHTIKRYRETSAADDRPRSGRPRTVRTSHVIKAVRERIRKNPLRNRKS